MNRSPLRPSLSRLLILGLVLLAAALPAQAGLNRWTPFGPPFTYARILAVAVVQPGPTAHLLAAPESGGVYRSEDDGRNWTWSGDGLVGVQVDRLVVAPSDPDVVYADGGALYRSDDAGRHWRQIYVPSSVIETLAVDPTDASLVYLGFSTALLRSRDRGETWEVIFDGTTVVQALAIDPVDPDNLYIGTIDGAFRSTDGGATWIEMTEVTTGGQGFRGRVTALAVAPGDPRTVYLSEEAGLFRSTDGGQTWALRSTGRTFLRLYVDPRSPLTVYGSDREGADVLVSRDGGASWKAVQFGKPDIAEVQDLVFDPSHRILYVATGTAGVVKIIRAGRWWQSGPERGLPAEYVASMQFHPADPARIYVRAGSSGRLFATRNGGRSWRLLAQPGPGIVFGEVIFDPADPETLYLANLGTVWRSTDDGATWRQLSGYPPTLDLAFPNRRTVVAAGCGIHLSTDAGRTFREVLPCQIPDDFVENDRMVTDLRTQPGDRSTLYALGTLTAGRHPTIITPEIYVSRDAGRTWSLSLSGGQFLAISPDRDGPLYAYDAKPPSPGKIRKSTDGGRTWQITSSTIPVEFYQVTDLEVDGEAPETLYLSTSVAGVFRSTDEGRTWEPINAGLTRLGFTDVHALVTHPVRPHTLYALPRYSGIFEGTFPLP